MDGPAVSLFTLFQPSPNVRFITPTRSFACRSTASERVIVMGIPYSKASTFLSSILLVCAYHSSARAADFCVATSAQLQSALDTASSNGSDDRIRLVAAVFPVAAAGFRYDSFGEPQHVELEGGYAEGCMTREPAGKSIIAAAGATGALGMHIKTASGSARLAHLVIRDMPDNGGSPNAALLLEGAEASIELEGNAFLFNKGANGSALRASSRAGVISLVDNVFYANTTRHWIVSAGGGGAASLAASACRFENNTFYGNALQPGGDDASFSVINCQAAVVASNVLYNNDGIDLRLVGVTGTQAVYLVDSNDLAEMSADPMVVVQSTGNISANPKLGLDPFVMYPPPDSPLVDAGSPQAGADNAGDFADRPRVVGNRVDIGAFEYSPRSLQQPLRMITPTRARAAWHRPVRRSPG